jgi:adenine specific DNA methylase Mod
MTWTNQLYYGDNLRVLREEIRDETVDLVYLDPPFNSAANYNVLFREASGEQSAAQIMAFEDTWHWSHESEGAYQELVTAPPNPHRRRPLKRQRNRPLPTHERRHLQTRHTPTPHTRRAERTVLAIRRAC